jgi:23S rRNA pseudouridine1911/1915/1917 synthase
VSKAITSQGPQELPALHSWTVPPESAGLRLDQFLVQQLESVSRSRIHLLLEQGHVLVNGSAAKPSLRLRGEEHIDITGEAEPKPLRAMAEEIPLDIVYEDDDLAVVNKPSGMMVHAGAGATDDARNRGTLVNAILHHFNSLSTSGGELRPGIVHRLDKETSGLIVVAKNDWTHGKLADMFASRKMSKTYFALVHGDLEKDSGTINAAISRDQVRRTRMTTKRDEGGRSAVSHYQVLKRFSGRYGKFTLVAVKIETGRTHQIRVHMSSIGHPVVGDTLYGAPARIVVPINISGKRKTQQQPEGISLGRNFLHSAELEFPHPRSGKVLTLKSPLPDELKTFLRTLDAAAEAKSKAIRY